MTALNKPTVGATGWGSDVNTNFDLIMESFATIAGGRLSVSSSDSAPTTDQTGSTLYYLPHSSSKVGIYDTTASAWGIKDIGSSGVSIGVSGLSADTNYDVFLYDSSGLTLELVAWTDATTRATAISRQDGVWVKGTGGGQAPERRYLGTVRTVAGINFTDAEQKRFVWNVANRLPRHGAHRDDASTSWNYNQSVWRGLNNGDPDWKFEFVRGLDEEPIEAYLVMAVSGFGAASYTYIAFGFDVANLADATNNAFAQVNAAAAGGEQMTLSYRRYASVGHHFIQGLEATGGGTSTFAGQGTSSVMTMTIVG